MHPPPGRWRGRLRRRTWMGEGRAALEVRGLWEAVPGVAAAVQEALDAEPGVRWVQVEGALGRVVVSFDDQRTDEARLVAVVEAAEAAAGVAERRFPLDAPELPGDRQPVRRQVWALAADGAGLALGVAGRVSRATPIPAEIAALSGLVDNEPRLRRLLEARLGTGPADLALAITGAVGQALTQGPLGLVTDLLHRANLLAEAARRGEAFARTETERWGDEPPPAVQPVAVADRPVGLPSGVIERYSDRAAVAAVAAGVAAGAATGSPRRGAAVALAGIPKAARLGRETFAARLGRALARRDVVVVDPQALRRLDRVDTVVLSDVLLPAPPGDEGAGGGGVHPAAIAVARAARRQGSMVVVAASPARPAGADQAGRDAGGLARRLGADLVVAGGAGLEESVRSMQGDGCVVALVAPGDGDHHAALAAADVSVEVTGRPGGGVWAGDLVATDLAEAAFVLDAAGAATDVSRRSVAVSAAGSGVGALVALGGRPGSSGARALGAVNAAAMVAMANAWRAAGAVERTGGRLPRPPSRWHEMPADEVLRRLGSGDAGLDAAEAARRHRPMEAQGMARPPSLTRAVGEELFNPFTPVLAAGAGASAMVGSTVDAAMVAAVALINSLVGGLQRYSAERAIFALTERAASPVRVRRPEGWETVVADALVPGDVVRLVAGDAVPADCRVVVADDLQVDESSLTGEPEPVTKAEAPVAAAVIGERTSMLYEGTTIAAGAVTAVVVAVGAETTAGELAGDSGPAPVASGVEGRLSQLTRVTLPASAAGGAAVMAAAFLHGRPVRDAVGSAVALGVAAVPEGLPILATMAQLASARRLSGRGALVRNPRAIEALGRVGVLCTDKTGTLTEGRIRLRRVSDGVDDVSLGDLETRRRRVIAAAVRASPEAGGPDGDFPHLTDRAVVRGASECGIGAQFGARAWRRGAELPFEPARGFHAVVGRAGASVVVSAKGAPEVILPRCRRWASPTGTVTIDDAVRCRLEAEVERLARQGLRILAVAERRERAGAGAGGERVAGAGELRDDDVSGLTLLGYLVLSDPIRSAASAALHGLRRAGVDVVMVTGDHPSTAEGVAVELGILDGRRLMTGAELGGLPDEDLAKVVRDVGVFARVAPADKVRIVTALQSRRLAVAMTGDGANDAPAIRCADAGIALGRRATPAARRAADLVVTDERIETIVDAIIEGRGMWTSVREALALLLGGNLGEVAFTVTVAAASGRAPLSARQLLAVNLLTDVAPALAIALRPPPERTPEALLAEGPDASLGATLERTIAVRAAGTAFGATAGWTLARLTGRRRRASTVALVALVGSQLGQTLLVGGRDPLVAAAGVGSAAVLAGLVQTPGISQFFGCTPLGPLGWTIAGGAAAAGTAASALGAVVASRQQRPGPPARDGDAVEARVGMQRW